MKKLMKMVGIVGISGVLILGIGIRIYKGIKDVFKTKGD